MATTYTSLSEAKIDDMVIAAIQASLPLFDAFSTQLDNTELTDSTTVTVPVVGAVTVADKTAGTLASATGSMTGVGVTTSNFKAGAFEIIEGKIAARNLAAWMEGQLAVAVRAVAQTVVNAALGLLTNTNYGTGKIDITGGIWDAAAVNEAVFGQFRTAARNKLKAVPGALICNSAIASRLITMQQVVYALASANKENAWINGALPGGIMGYQAFEYTDLPGNSENLVAAVVGKSAIAVAAGAPSQIIKSGDGDVAYRRLITDPESGLTLQYTEVVSGGGKITCEVGCMYGAAKAQDAALLLHVTPSA